MKRLLLLLSLVPSLLLAQSYSYTKATDFTTTTVDSGLLHEEIEASAIVTPLSHVEETPTVVTVIFPTALSPGDKTLLDGNTLAPAGGLIGAHTGTPPTVPAESVPPVIEETMPPGIVQDSTMGFSVGDVWVDSTTLEAYVAVDVTTGSAVWTSITTNTTASTLVLPIQTVVANHVITSTDKVVLVDTTSGNVTVTLPAAAGWTGKQLWIKKITAANVVTVDGNGAETIDGDLTQQWSEKNLSLTLISDGTAWFLQ